MTTHFAGGRRLPRTSIWLCVWLASLALPANLARAAEDDDPRRPSAIETQSVPAVPDELFERLSQYQNIRSARFSGWSPDGRGMLIATRFGNATQLHRVYEPGGRREQVTFFDEPASGRFIPEATDGAIHVMMSRGGDEKYQIYLLDRTTGRATLLTDGASRNLPGPMLDDGSQMIVHSTQRNGRDTDIYVADPRRADSLEMLFEVDGEYWTARDWSPDGSRLILNRYVSINETYPALFDIEERRLEPLPPVGEGKVAYSDFAFSGDGRSLFLTCDGRGEFLALARFDLATSEYEWLADDIEWNVDALEVDRTTGRLAFTANEDGASALYVWHDGERRRLETPLGIIGGLEFSPDGSQLGFTLSRPDRPSDAYSIALFDGTLMQWTFSEVGGLDVEQFVAPERISYETFDGRQIPAYYYRPHGDRNKPAAVLVNIHGGPESQYRPYFSSVTQFYVNELGLAVIHPNVRGSAGYGKSYLQMDNGPLREDSVRDIGALLDWISTQPDLDPQRVAVAGGSYGGYMVLASLVHFGERLRAGVDIVGIANFITFLERTSPYRQDLRRAEYGDERDPEMRAVFERINPTSGAERIRSALLVAHGVNDPRVPFFEAEQIADRVRATGQNVWTIYADNEGHGFAKKDNRDYLTAVIVMFLDEQLK